MPTISVSGIGPTASGTSHSVTVTAPTSSQLLVVFVMGNSGPSLNSSVTDDGGGTWTFDVGTTLNFGFYRRSGGSTSGSIVVSWTTSGTDVCWGAAFYLSGVATTSPVDATSAFSSSGFTTTPSVTITTNTNNCAILGQIYRTGGGTPTLTPTSPAQLYQDSTYTSTHLLYVEDAGTAGSETLEGTWSVGSGQERFGVAYKASSSSAAKPAMHYARLRTA